MDSVRRQNALLGALVLAFVGALLFVRISAFGIWDPWELGTADTARHLLAGEPVKAPASFSTWLVSLGFAQFGVHEWAGRAPIALAGLLTALLAFWLVGRAAGPRAGFYAALISSTSPLFVFNARAMLGDAPAFAAQTLVAACALGAVFPSHDETTPGATKRALFAVALLGAIWLSLTARGALLGPLPPLAAVGLVALLVLEPSDALGRTLAAGMLVVALGLIAMIGRAILADSVEPSVWTGGAVTNAATPTFDLVLEEIFHAFAPWSALLPVAIAASWQALLAGRDGEAGAEGDTLARATRGESALLLVALTWAAIAYAAQTLFFSRYGRGASFLPVVALSAVVALFLVQLERQRSGSWGLAVAALFLVGLVLRDYALYPNGPVDGLPIASFDLPKVFNPRAQWAMLLSAFGACALFGFGADTSPALDLAAPYRLAREQWRRSLGHKLWLIAFALGLLAMLTFGALAYAIPGKLHLNTLAAKWVKRLVFVPPMIALGVAGMQLAVFAFGKLGRFRLAPLLCAGAAMGIYASQGFLPALSEHFSPREVYETYNSLAKNGEALGEYRVGGRAAAYYAKGKVVELNSITALVEHMSGQSRRWAAFPADELASIDRAFRKKTGEHIVVADNRSARVLLGTNLPLSGKQQESFLQAHVHKTAPAKIQHPLSISFDERIELLGYDLSLPHGSYVGAGESFKVTWYFRALQSVGGDYKIFLHVDGEGQRIHGDHDPVDGKYPVRLWDEGDVISDEQTLDVPASYRAGDYTIYLGFYSGDKRLPVKRGPSDGDDRAQVGVLRIQ